MILNTLPLNAFLIASENPYRLTAILEGAFRGPGTPKGALFKLSRPPYARLKDTQKLCETAAKDFQLCLGQATISLRFGFGFRV